MSEVTTTELPVVAASDEMVAGQHELADARRAQFDQEAARKPPAVLKGSELSSSTYWHGKKLDDWANAWVS